ncbi:MAG: hypothetical protein ACPGSE_00420 [Synechococcus sp.]
MALHPEVPSDSELGQIHAQFDDLVNAEVVDVWCKGCNDWRKMNAVYAKHLAGEIESCGVCR